MNPTTLSVSTKTPETKTMDTDHKIDVAVAAVETELQIERENNSKTAETISKYKDRLSNDDNLFSSGHFVTENLRRDFRGSASIVLGIIQMLRTSLQTPVFFVL